MRIGILTFHRSINYGAYMQSLSLSHEIAKRFPSCEVENVDYNSLIMENNYKVRFNKSMLRLPKEYFAKKDRKAVFLDSLKYLPLSPETIFDDGCEKVFEYIKSRYDIIVTGSDAIFNWIKRGFPNPYLLGVDNIIKLSYAASASNMPMKYVTPNRKEEFGRYLRDYDFISVRDSYTKDLVKYCSGLDAHTVCDPSAFLDLEYVEQRIGITRKELKEKIYNKYNIPKNKRLIGFMGTNRVLMRKVREKYSDTHCVVSMFGCSGEEDVYIHDINPLEWSLIFSLFDITFSSFFHGLMLSYRNNVPCIGVDLTPFANNYKNKIEDILCRMGFEDCFFTLAEGRYDRWEKVIEKADELMKRNDLAEIIENNLKSFASTSDVFFNRLAELVGEKNKEIEKLEFISPKKGFTPNKNYTCMGCSLCEKKCPNGAIKMTVDRGFYFPQIDKNKCTECGLCNRVCPVNHEKVKIEPKEIYAVASKDNELLLSSSSGGAFGVMAEQIIKDGGAVSGVAYDSQMRAKHTIARTKEELKAFHGSKYVQADMGNIYSELENELKTGKKVLASGTPCQIAALKEYFGDKYENLILLDIICTGVQSPRMFEGYIKSLEEKYSKKIVDLSFRDKTNGWKKKTIKVTFDDGSEMKFPSEKCDYYDMFYILRTSCYRCTFKNFNDYADITLGDYWGIETLTDKFDMKKGVSIVLAKTDKGKELIDSVKDNVIVEKSNLDHAIKTHKKLISSEVMPKYRDAVCEALSQGGYQKARKTYLSQTRLYRFKSKILKKK